MMGVSDIDLRLNDQSRHGGFFCTRFVDADSVDDAIEAAMRLVVADVQERQLTSTSNWQQSLRAEAVWSSPWYAGRFFGNSGYTFYLPNAE
jgi:hypothetical protein